MGRGQGGVAELTTASRRGGLSGDALREALGEELDLSRPQQDAAELWILGASEELNPTIDEEGLAHGSFYDAYSDKEVPLEKIAKGLGKAMRPLAFDIVVYRALSHGLVDEERVVGHFMSTALTLAGTKKFGDNAMELHVPKGTPALWLGPLTEGEDELLLGRGLKLTPRSTKAHGKHQLQIVDVGPATLGS